MARRDKAVAGSQTCVFLRHGAHPNVGQPFVHGPTQCWEHARCSAGSTRGAVLGARAAQCREHARRSARTRGIRTRTHCSPSVPLNEYEYPESRLPALVANKLKTLIETNYYLYKSARDAYRSYMLSYHSHSMKNIFDVSKLDVMKVCGGRAVRR